MVLFGAVSQQVIGNRPGKERVTLEHGQSVAHAIAETAFLRGFQHGLDLLDAPGRLCAVRHVHHFLPYFRR